MLIVLRKTARAAVLSIIVACVPLSAQAAPWLMGVAPRHSHASTVYAPLGRFIARAAGHPVKVWRPGRNWFVYANAIVTGRFALAFDGAIFTAWRDQARHYHPLVRLQGPMRFWVVTTGASRDIRRMADLDGRPVCANPLPNMATMILLAQTSPVAVPYIEPMGGIRKDFKGLLGGECQAAIFPSRFVRHLPPAARAGLRVLYKTRAYPNLALSAGPQLTAIQRARIRAALLSPQGEAIARQVFHGARFVPASRAEYAPYAQDLPHMPFFTAMVQAADRNQAVRMAAGGAGHTETVADIKAHRAR
jgi:hypothetical protein